MPFVSSPERPSTSTPLTDEQRAMVEKNVRLVYWWARRLEKKYPAADVEELASYGMDGLMRASQLFDPSLGFAFSTYSANWIRNKIEDGYERAYGKHEGVLSLDMELHQDGDGRTYGDVMSGDLDCEGDGIEGALLSQAQDVIDQFPPYLKISVPLLANEGVGKQLEEATGIPTYTLFMARDLGLWHLRKAVGEEPGDQPHALSDEQQHRLTMAYYMKGRTKGEEMNESEFVPVVPDKVLENLRPTLVRRGRAKQVAEREANLLVVNTRGLVQIAERLEAEARLIKAERELARQEAAQAKEQAEPRAAVLSLKHGEVAS